MKSGGVGGGGVCGGGETVRGTCIQQEGVVFVHDQIFFLLLFLRQNKRGGLI